jgi:uncharacterized protein YrrD
MKLELREGTSVFTTSGEEVGKINRFVLDPETNEVTHIVVQKGWLFAEDKVVPLDWVSSATDERVTLNENADDFDQLPAFEETHFIGVTEEGTSPADSPPYRYTPAYYWYPPAGYIGHPVGYYGWPPMETQRNIPADTIPLREGSNVMSSDGKHVGDIERIFVDSESNQVTHFLISEGLLFKERKLVPAHWVRTAEEDKVHLNMSSQMLERLPTYQS